jgi:hypothetical protein
MKLFSTLLLLVAVATLHSAAHPITLTSIHGNSAEVDVVGVDASEVTFLRNGQRLTMKLSELTDASRTTLIEEAKAKKIYTSCPPLRVQVKIGTKNIRDEYVTYRIHQTINPQVVIGGTTFMESIPALEATMVVITMDTREKYVKNREKYSVYSSETIKIEPAANGNAREFDFAPGKVTYDAWRDETNVGGSAYKYYVFGLRDPATNELVNFQTNNPGLQRQAATKPELREQMLKLARGAEFPADF